MLGSPSRRRTRGSERRRRADGTDELAGAGTEPPDLTSVSQSEDFSSNSELETGTESESDAEQQCMPTLVCESDDTEGECAMDESRAEKIDMSLESDDEASRKLAWSLAAQEAGVTLVVPSSSADESSCDEAGLRPETDYESALSADEDQDTVVDVSTRKTVQKTGILIIPKTSRSADQVARAQGAMETLKTGASSGVSRRAPPGVRPEVPATPEPVNQHMDCTFCTHMAAAQPPPVRVSRANSEIALHEGMEIDRAQCEREEVRREQAQHRRKSRHTKVSEAPECPDALGHRKMRQTAAGDQRQSSHKTSHHRELLPLKEPSDEDQDVQYNSAKPSRGHYQSHESGLRMPLFDGGDWAGFMSQFEACINYYGWTEKTKTIRLYTSIVGKARKTLGAVNANTWSYAQLKKHMEVRYGRSKVYAQIQSELLSRTRKAGQTLHEYHDELVAASYTANISEAKRVELIHTAFVFGLRNNPHMHRWVTKRELETTIESALEAAEAYEDEYGSEPVFQSMPVSVNTRDATGNPLAVALLGRDNTDTQSKSVSVDAVQTVENDGSMQALMSTEFKQLKGHITQKFDTLDGRLGDLEKWQASQIKRFKESAEKRKKFRDNNRAKNHNKKKNRSDNDEPAEDSKSGGGRNDKNQGSKNKKNNQTDVNTRSAAGNDSDGSNE